MAFLPKAIEYGDSVTLAFAPTAIDAAGLLVVVFLGCVYTVSEFLTNALGPIAILNREFSILASLF